MGERGSRISAVHTHVFNLKVAMDVFLSIIALKTSAKQCNRPNQSWKIQCQPPQYLFVLWQLLQLEQRMSYKGGPVGVQLR